MNSVCFTPNDLYVCAGIKNEVVVIQNLLYIK